MIGLETWPGKDGWMKRKPLGLRITTSERVYSKERLDTIINSHVTYQSVILLLYYSHVKLLYGY
jgi:hypothetical protein